MKIDLYNDTGKKVGDVAVSDDMFGIAFNEGLVHQAVVRQQSNGRHAIAKTKTKADVRGGGRKPWKQKGTGRARVGSIRSPLWKGGGVVFGPTGRENYSIQMPKKQRRLALWSALSEKIREGGVFALEAYTSTEVKTKIFAEMLKKLPVERSILVVIAGAEGDGVAIKSAKNIPNVRVVQASYLNILDILKYKHVVFLQNSLEVVENTFKI